MASKLRPPNARGPNGLRGGIKTYSAKTVTGSWLDELGGPEGYKRGFTTADYETEGQHQQLGVSLKPAPYFGSALPDDRVAGRPSSPFKYEQTSRHNADELSPWMSNTQLMTQSVLVRDKEKEEATALKPHIPQDQLERYRKTWTSEENDKLREMRFTTETRRAAALAVGGNFAVTSVRFLPGTPKPMESCREQLVRKYGVLCFAVVRDTLGKKATDGMVSLPDFRIAMRELGVELKLYEINQMIAFVTPSATLLPVENFIYSLRGTAQNTGKVVVENIFQRVAMQQGDNKRRVPFPAFEHAINADEYPEFLQGFVTYASAYSATKTDFSLDEFVEMMYEMYLASPQLYQEAITHLWIV